MPLAPPCSLDRCSCAQRWSAGHRCLQEAGSFQQRGAPQPQGAVSETNTQNAPKKRKEQDSCPFSKPPVCPIRANLIRFRTCQGHTQPACTGQRTAAPALPGGSPGSSPHGPSEGADSWPCSVLCSWPGPRPRPQSGTSGLPGREGRLFTRPPCLQLRLLRGFVLSTPGSESLSPGLARRRGALESLGHTASLRGQGTPCPESERPQKVIHSVQRGREHCPRGPVQSLPCRLCQRGSCDPSP